MHSCLNTKDGQIAKCLPFNIGNAIVRIRYKIVLSIYYNCRLTRLWPVSVNPFTFYSNRSLQKFSTINLVLFSMESAIYFRFVKKNIVIILITDFPPRSMCTVSVKSSLYSIRGCMAKIIRLTAKLRYSLKCRW